MGDEGDFYKCVRVYRCETGDFLFASSLSLCFEIDVTYEDVAPFFYYRVFEKCEGIFFFFYKLC